MGWHGLVVTCRVAGRPTGLPTWREQRQKQGKGRKAFRAGVWRGRLSRGWERGGRVTQRFYWRRYADGPLRGQLASARLYARESPLTEVEWWVAVRGARGGGLRGCEQSKGGARSPRGWARGLYPPTTPIPLSPSLSLYLSIYLYLSLSAFLLLLSSRFLLSSSHPPMSLFDTALLCRITSIHRVHTPARAPISHAGTHVSLLGCSFVRSRFLFAVIERRGIHRKASSCIYVNGFFELLSRPCMTMYNRSRYVWL